MIGSRSVVRQPHARCFCARVRAVHAEILTIGDELCRGEIVDSNSAYLAARLWELPPDTRRNRTLRHPGRMPERVAFSPDGKLLASGSYDHTARIWDAQTGKLVHVLQHQGYVFAESFSRDGRSLVTSPPADTTALRAAVELFASTM